MPNFNFGDKLSFDRNSMYLALKSKNEEAYVRFVGGGNFDSKHFIQQDSKWVVTYCPRIMQQKECSYCEKFYALKKQEKEEKDEKLKKELQKQMRTFRPKITFYYPVVDRMTEEAKIFKTVLSIRLYLEQELEAGIKVTDFDYKFKRTENAGADYYSKTRLDSSMIKPLTEKEKKAVQKAKAFDLEEIVHGNDSSLELEAEIT